MPEMQLGPLIEAMDFASRLEFLYRVVEDTQDTIRFLDTKAAFCVTLLSGMTAGVLQRGHGGEANRLVFVVFMAMVAVSLLVCLRVIFPTIKPAGSMAQTRGPKFFIGHNKAHHWIVHTVRNKVDAVLSETHDSYVKSFHDATDQDLISSMCDEVLMVSLIRQIKGDRLHAAMFCLTATVFCFAALMIL